MRKRLIISIIIGIIICSFGITIFPTQCYADDFGITDLDKYNSTPSANDYDRFISEISKRAGAISVVGVVISVVMLIIIGIKYMLGSVEEKAEYKKTMMPYLIGAFLVFTVSLVPNIIYQFMQNFK